MPTHHPVAIIGGGLGGLVAARVLHTHGIESVVFELEPHRDSRVQGGMLDIHDYNGQKAIRAAGLWEEFTRLIHPGGEAMRILDHTGAVLRDEPDGGDRSRPEVDRGELRDLLIDSLPEGTIRWGRKVTDVRRDPDVPGRHRVTFADGEVVTTDLLVGADGAWSRVRPLVSDARPAYTGVSFVEADLRDAREQHPAEADAMGDGMMFAFRGETGFIGHLETDGSLHAYLGVRVAEDWVDTIDFADVPASKAAVLELLDGWSAPLRGLIAHADAPLVPRRIHALPVGHRWDRVPGVTLLGDAAHLMSPFAGEGANLAMYDGAQLALAVAHHPGDVEAALTAYEAEMFPRSEEAAEETARNLDLLYSETSPQPLVEMFRQIDEQVAAEAAGTTGAAVPTIAIVVASTRPGRQGAGIAAWVQEQASTRGDARFELVDLAEADLPPIDEIVPPSRGVYSQPHTRAWAETVARFDGYVFVTPEYNHGYPGSLKNALDRVYAEWGHKAAGFVSYGVDGGVRAVEQLRSVVATLKLADVGPTVSLNLHTDFTDRTDLTPRDHQAGVLSTLLDEVVAWSTALATLRVPAPA